MERYFCKKIFLERFSIILLFFCSFVFAQKKLPFDSLKVQEAKDLLADDYGNIYISRNKDFSFTKYDSLGKQLGKLMFTVPFKVQTVQNPLSIPFFSENAQEIKFVDQNLNEIQKIDLRNKFTYIKNAYAEDLQQVWLIEESTKRLIQYNFRNDTTINSYLMTNIFDDIIDFLIFENKMYSITKSHFRIHNLKFDLLLELPLENAKRFRRENDIILIMTSNSILKYNGENQLDPIFSDENSKIVDKNSLGFFEIKDNKLYLYTHKIITDLKSQKEKNLPLENNPEDELLESIKPSLSEENEGVEGDVNEAQ